MSVQQMMFLTVILASGISRCLAADTNSTTPPTRPIPVILDTDIGGDMDDTWAMVFLLKSPQFDIKLITTTSGQAEYRAKVIAKLLTVAGRTNIPVALGEGGRDGSGPQLPWVKNYKLADYPGKILQDGAGAVVDVINRSPQPVTVISIGPLHTMAKALKLDPQIASKANFAGMFGSVRKGYDDHKTIDAEFNVAENRVAARKVLSAPWRQITITPLDTCDLVKLSGKRFQSLKRSRDPLIQALLENYRIWAGKRSLDELQASSKLFDTAAVYLANPGDKPLVKLETLSIRVTDDAFTRIDPKGKNMSVATEWKDLNRFHDLLVKTLLTTR